MGFFSSVCSFFSGVARGIGSAISSLCSGIGGLLSSAVSGFAGALGVVGATIGLAPLQVVVAAVVVVSKLAEALGLKKEMKAECADKKPEDFDTTEEYINYLHKEIKLDIEQQERLRKMSPDQRSAYQLTGSYLYLKASAEKLGLDDTTINNSTDIKGLDPQFILDSYKLGLSGEEIVSYIKNMQKQGINDTKCMSDYLHNKAESIETANKVLDAIVYTIKENNPSISEDGIDEKINEMRDCL